MAGVVAGTHAAIWYLLGSDELSWIALQVLDETVARGDPIHIASIDHS
jgi:hypothetical protein